MEQFDDGAFDDFVDAVVYGIRYLQKERGGSGVEVVEHRALTDHSRSEQAPYDPRYA